MSRGYVKEEALLSFIYLDLKPPSAYEVAAKPYAVEYITSSFKSLMEEGEIRGSMPSIFFIIWGLMLMILICA